MASIATATTMPHGAFVYDDFFSHDEWRVNVDKHWRANQPRYDDQPYYGYVPEIDEAVYEGKYFAQSHHHYDPNDLEADEDEVDLLCSELDPYEQRRGMKRKLLGLHDSWTIFDRHDETVEEGLERSRNERARQPGRSWKWSRGSQFHPL